MYAMLTLLVHDTFLDNTIFNVLSYLEVTHTDTYDIELFVGRNQSGTIEKISLLLELLLLISKECNSKVMCYSNQWKYCSNQRKLCI